MNTIERIEARRSQPSCHDQTEWYRVTADELGAIRALIEAAKDGCAALDTKAGIWERPTVTRLREALSKLEN